MDSQWAADILQRRVYKTIGHFYVPCPLDHFHSLFYHAVVHKENFEHRETLLAMALTQSDGAVGKDFDLVPTCFPRCCESPDCALLLMLAL